MRIIAQQYKLVPVDQLLTHPRNPRIGDVELIGESIKENGFYGACVVQKTTNHILAGNHRYKAAIEEGATEIPVIFVDVDDDEALRIVLADNGTSDEAGYDNEALLRLLKEMADTDRGLAGTSFKLEDIAELTASMVGQETEDQGEGGGGTGGDGTKGELLKLVGLTLAEPSTIPAVGSVWNLNSHVLVVCDNVFTGWPSYMPLLDEGSLLVPLPSPLIVFSEKYDTERLVMVQPNRYIAGHLLDRHKERYPDSPATERVAAS